MNNLEQAKEMYLNIKGITIKQIAEKLNINEKDIKKYFKENNVKIEKRGNNPNLFIYLEAMELYKRKEYSLCQLSDMYNINRGCLSAYFKKCGVEVEKLPHKKKCNTRIFRIIDTEEKAYWLGFLYADGCVSNNRNTVEIALCEKDKKHLEKFKNFIQSEHKICFHPNDMGNSYRISIRDDDLKQDLINLGCVPQKSLILTFPSEEKVNKLLVKHFIRGYFDGDGCVCKTEKTEYIDLLGTFEFLSSVKNILDDENIKTTMVPLKKDSGKNTFRLVITNKDGRKKFLEYIYKDAKIYLDRKYNKFLII